MVSIVFTQNLFNDLLSWVSSFSSMIMSSSIALLIHFLCICTMQCIQSLLLFCDKNFRVQYWWILPYHHFIANQVCICIFPLLAARICLYFSKEKSKTFKYIHQRVGRYSSFLKWIWGHEGLINLNMTITIRKFQEIFFELAIFVCLLSTDAL